MARTRSMSPRQEKVGECVPMRSDGPARVRDHETPARPCARGFDARRRDVLRGASHSGGLPWAPGCMPARGMRPRPRGSSSCPLPTPQGRGDVGPWTSYADPGGHPVNARGGGIDADDHLPPSRTRPTTARTRRRPPRGQGTPASSSGSPSTDPVPRRAIMFGLLTRLDTPARLNGLKACTRPDREVLAPSPTEVPILFHPPKVADYH